MRVKFMLILFLFGVGCVLNVQSQEQIQTANWDSLYRPAGSGLKIGNFNSFAHSKNDVIFLGNSITANTNWNELLEMPNAHNRGISGDITYGVLERLNEVINGRPKKVFILIGINDITRNIPDNNILANYERIIKRIKTGSPNTKIYFYTLLPVNKTFTQLKNQDNTDKHIYAVNEGLKKITEKEKITLIDIHTPFMDAEGRLKKELTPDGLHLNADGYQLWKKILKEGGYLK